MSGVDLQHAEGAVTADGGPLSSDDLAGLMAGFTEVSAKLEATHRTLQSEVRRLNAELRRANEELDRSRRLAALGEMAAGIAHEVRNPLGSIALYARMVEEDVGEHTGAVGMLRKIGSAVTGLNAVVNDVLSFSRELRVTRQPTPTDELFERAASACGDLSPRPMLASGGELWVDCDPLLAHQALVNVIRNACEAARGSADGTSGVVEVRAEHAEIEVDGDRPSSAVALVVADNGPGIPPEVVARMFNPFFTTRAAGTGLGLAIVHRIMDAHGGTVRVHRGGKGMGAKVELVFADTAGREGEREMAREAGAHE